MYEWRAKAWMILHACAEWSESAHFAHVQRHFSLDQAFIILLLGFKANVLAKQLCCIQTKCIDYIEKWP